MKLNKLKLKQANKLYSLLGIILIIVLFLLAYRKLWGAGMFAYGDCASLPDSAATAFKTFFTAWHPRKPGINLGAPWFLITGTLIFIFGNNAPLAQKILHFSPLLLSFLTMLIFLNQFVKSRFAKYIAAFVYSVNPITMGEFLGGGDSSVYVHALFPLLLIFLWRLLHDRKILNLLIFTLLLTLAYSWADYVLIILFPFVLFFLAHSLFMNRKPHLGFKKIILSSFVVLLPFIFCFLLLFPYTFPFLKTALPFLAGPRNLLPTNVLMQLIGDLKYCYNAWTLDKIIRLGGSLYAPLFGGSVAWTQFGYILPLLAFSSLFFIRDRKNRKFIMGFVILSVLTILFIWLTHLKLILGLFRTFPFLGRFRNPVRPILFLVFTYAPLIAITIEGIQKKLDVSFTRLLTNSWRSRPIIISLLLSLIIAGSISIFNWPFFTGDLTLKHNRGSNYEIPSHFYEIGKWLQERRSSEGFFRTLWLPWTYEETETNLKWLDPYTLSVGLGYGQYAQSPLVDYIEFVFRSLANEQTECLGDLLSLANVKYMVVNLASRQKGPSRAAIGYFTPYLFGAPQNFIYLLNKEKDFELVVDRKDYWIYRNKKFIPHLTSYSKVSFISSQSKSDPLFLLSYLLTDDLLHPQDELLLFANSLSPDQESRILNYLGEGKEKVVVSPEYSFLDDDFDRDILNKKNWLPTLKPLKFIHSTEVILPLKQGEVGFLMSKGEFRYPVVFETRAKLSPESLHADIRLEYDGSDGAMFALESDSNLSLSTYNSWQITKTKLGVHDFTKYHVYKLIWEEEKVRFYVDGDLKATHTTNVPVKWAKVRFGGTSGQTFTIDYVKVERYKEEPTTTIFKAQMASLLYFNAAKISETEYRVEIENQEPVFIFLGEAYHPSWNGYVNGERLEHFPAFYWANGFYLNKAGENRVEIVYEEQKIKNRMVLISGIFWLFFLGSLLVVFTKEIIVPYLYKTEGKAYLRRKIKL